MSYLTTVLADTPRHFWRCADGGGQIAHDIGAAVFHLSGGINLLGYSGPNSDGGSFLDNGVNGLTSQGNTIPLVTSPFSLELWFWPLHLPTGAVEILCAWNNSSPGQASIYWNTTGVVQSSVEAVNVFAVLPVTIQRWHHVVVTSDGATERLYIDGAFSQGALVGASSILKVIAFGETPAGGNAFYGCLSELAVYNTTLSAVRVAAHYAAADQVAQAPVFTMVAGNQSVPGVNAGSAPGGTTQILGGLQRTWQNAP